MAIALSVQELVGMSDWIVFVLMLVLIGLDRVRRAQSGLRRDEVLDELPRREYDRRVRQARLGDSGRG